MEIKRARENFSKNTPFTITDKALLFIFKRILKIPYMNWRKKKELDIYDLFFRMLSIHLD